MRHTTTSLIFLAAASAVALMSHGTVHAQATISPEAPLAGSAAPQGADKSKAERGWWNGAIFYQVFVRSFSDSSGGPLANDGIGDIQGLIDKLDYLNDGKRDPDAKGESLGITAIWLMPIMESPSYHGYDTTDYYRVEPDYGTNDDFKRLADECKKRGIRLIIDYVPNHHSNQHDWFRRALEPKSKFHDWYIWSDKEPNWKGPWNQKVWHRIAKPDGTPIYYYGLFSHTMPDLNFRNPEVDAELKKVARFWLEEMKVDGFRLDAIRHLVEEGKVQENTASTHNWLKGYNKFVKEVNDNCFSVGEVWSTTEIASSYVGDELDSTFEFDLSNTILEACRSGKADKLGAQIQRTVAQFPKDHASIFLANHDQPRTLTALKGDLNLARLAAMLQFTMPGIPFIYYGEEIGMTGDKPDEKIRTPMQWSDDKFAGFSTVKPWQAVNNTFRQFNVKDQSIDPASHLTLYKKLIRTRQRTDALRLGETHVAKVEGSPGLLVVVRKGPVVKRVLPATATAPEQEIITHMPSVVGLFNLSGSEIVLPSLRMDQLGLTELAAQPGKLTADLLLTSRANYTPDIAEPKNGDDAVRGWLPVSRIPTKTGLWIQVSNK